MEIKTSMVTCPSCGHPYDSAKNARCPRCGGSFAPTEAPGSGAGGFTPTEPLNGGFTPTEAPMGGAGGNYSANFGATTPPDGGASPSGGANPFDVPTVIGGGKADGDIAEPVVGWLVCIEGPARGSDFRLHAGYNYIGRESGDVRIRGDQQISRQNHAMVAYDSGEHLYFVGPSAGRNLIKVNGHAVLQAIAIKNYDIISIGTTKLIFVGLCGEQFSWEKREQGNG